MQHLIPKRGKKFKIWISSILKIIYNRQHGEGDDAVNLGGKQCQKVMLLVLIICIME